MHERRYSAEIERLRSKDRIERLEVERVVDLCLEGKGRSTVLDVGTGSGLFAEQFVRKGASVTGIDPNPEMLAAARLFVPEAKFEQATVEAIPFPDKSFDIVFLGVVLHEADDVRRALSECRRVARGSVEILEWAYREEDFGPPLEHRLEPQAVLAMAEEAGFRSRDVHPLKHLLLYYILLITVRTKPCGNSFCSCFSLCR